MKVLVADDHGLFRDGLIMQLRRIDTEATVTEAQSFDQVRTLLQGGAAFDFAFIDLMMPGEPWSIELPKLMALLRPSVVVVVSAIETPKLIQEAFSHGVSGFIPKKSDRKVIANALKLILDGGVYLPPEMIPCLEDPSGVSGGGGVGANLTPRQKEVLLLLCRGMSNKQIAFSLDLSEATVKLHLNGVLRCLNARNRTEAAMIARDMGLVDG